MWRDDAQRSLSSLSIIIYLPGFLLNIPWPWLVQPGPLDLHIAYAFGTRTRTNTIPNGTKANATGLSGRARVARDGSGMGRFWASAEAPRLDE